MLMKEFTLAAHLQGYDVYQAVAAVFRPGSALRFLLRFARPLQLLPVFFRLVGIGDAEVGHRFGEGVAEPM